MTQEFVTTGVIERGMLRVRNRAELEAWAKVQRNGEVTVHVERLHATRNLEQNSLYFAGYVRPLAEFFGWTVNDMHAYLKARFLPANKRRMKTLLLHDPQTGEVLDEFELDESTTTTLNKIEFSDYLHDIEIWAAEKGAHVGSNREKEPA